MQKVYNSLKLQRMFLQAEGNLLRAILTMVLFAKPARLWSLA